MRIIQAFCSALSGKVLETSFSSEYIVLRSLPLLSQRAADIVGIAAHHHGFEISKSPRRYPWSEAPLLWIASVGVWASLTALLIWDVVRHRDRYKNDLEGSSEQIKPGVVRNYALWIIASAINMHVFYSSCVKVTDKW